MFFVPIIQQQHQKLLHNSILIKNLALHKFSLSIRVEKLLNELIIFYFSRKLVNWSYTKNHMYILHQKLPPQFPIVFNESVSYLWALSFFLAIIMLMKKPITDSLSSFVLLHSKKNYLLWLIQLQGRLHIQFLVF